MSEASRPDLKRNARIAFSLLAIAGLAWLVTTPAGGWVQSWFFGTGARWQNAYVALETAEMNLPREGRERERLLEAWALTDSEPPVEFKWGPRLHPVGSLAHLRYETFDEKGEPLDAWDVRALVPNIGNGNGPFWREPCERSCREEIAQSSGTRLHRSGEAGVAEEVVLRMPVGRAFTLKPRPLQTHDILDTRPRMVPLGSVRIDDKTVHVPSKIRVTLLAACAADVRVGTTMNVKFAQNATVPVPLGFTTSRWAQLDGCGKLEPFEPPPKQVPMPAVHVKVDLPDLRALVARRDPKTGAGALRVDEAWLRTHNMPVVVHVDLICRYDAAADKWQLLPRPDQRLSWRLEPLSDADAALGNRVAFEVPKETGLYWLHWSERNDVNPVERLAVNRHSLVVSGPILCNDIMIGEPPPGKVATCVPFDNRAEARFVPEPYKACTQ